MKHLIFGSTTLELCSLTTLGSTAKHQNSSPNQVRKPLSINLVELLKLKITFREYSTNLDVCTQETIWKKTEKFNKDDGYRRSMKIFCPQIKTQRRHCKIYIGRQTNISNKAAETLNIQIYVMLSYRKTSQLISVKNTTPHFLFYS